MNQCSLPPRLPPPVAAPPRGPCFPGHSPRPRSLPPQELVHLGSFDGSALWQIMRTLPRKLAVCSLVHPFPAPPIQRDPRVICKATETSPWHLPLPWVTWSPRARPSFCGFPGSWPGPSPLTSASECVISKARFSALLLLLFFFFFMK